MPSTIKPIPLSGARVRITGGLYRGADAVIDTINRGRVYCHTVRKDTRILIGPIDPAHIQEVPR